MIDCRNIIKEFGKPAQQILHGLTFKIEDGEFVSISGRSGSGKSTLLYIISSLDLPTKGDVFLDGKSINDMSSEESHRFRNVNVGFIFQFHYLLSELSVVENVLLPARNLNLMDEKRHEAVELLNQLGLATHIDKYPNELSGGEQQRVAIARALILKPKYIFADEPTGNLDTYNARLVMTILREVNKRDKTTICLVTHEPSFAAMAEREIYLIDGRIASRSEDIL